MNQRLKLSCSALALGLMLGFQASPVVAVKDGAEEAIRRINARKNAPQLSEEVEALRAGNMQLQQQLADFEQQHAQLADVARRVHVSLVDEPQNPIEDVERVREMLAPIE